MLLYCNYILFIHTSRHHLIWCITLFFPLRPPYFGIAILFHSCLVLALFFFFSFVFVCFSLCLFVYLYLCLLFVCLVVWGIDYFVDEANPLYCFFAVALPVSWFHFMTHFDCATATKSSVSFLSCTCVASFVSWFSGTNWVAAGTTSRVFVLAFYVCVSLLISWFDETCRFWTSATKPGCLRRLEKTLQWRHMAPTAPETLGCYPFVTADPFIIEVPYSCWRRCCCSCSCSV